MKIKYSFFQRYLNDDSFRPGAFSLDAHNEHEAIHKAMQIATNFGTSSITVLFAYEEDEPSRARVICGWKKGAEGTIKPLPQNEVEKYFNEFEAKQKIFRYSQ